MASAEIRVRLPDWVASLVAAAPRAFPTQESRVAFVVALAWANIEHGTGGPFGAAVFDIETGRLVAPGVNLVVSAGCSVLHAEIVAIIGAQRALKSFDLGAVAPSGFELATSAAPCAMCLGAIPWSGVRRLVCGARGEDVERIGFDEGAKPEAWHERLAERGIEVIHDVCRDEAVAVLREYAGRGGPIYNSTRDARNAG